MTAACGEFSYLVPEYRCGEFAIGDLAGEVIIVPADKIDAVPWDDDPEVEEGWFCRLASKDGAYATFWTGSFEKKQDAMDYIEEVFGVDPNTGSFDEEKDAA